MKCEVTENASAATKFHTDAARKITVTWLLQRRRGIEFKASVMVLVSLQKTGENERPLTSEHYGDTIE